MKYCMDCYFFHGKLSREDREFLVKLLERYDGALMLRSWVELGQIKDSRGKPDPDKAKAAEMLKRSRSFCMKEHALVYALEVGCAFHVEKK